MKYLILFLILFVTISHAGMVDLKYWEDDGELNCTTYRYAATKFRLNDFDPEMIGFEVHSLEIRTRGECDTYTTVYFFAGNDYPVEGEEVYSFQPYIIYGINNLELPEPVVIENERIWVVIDQLGNIEDAIIWTRCYYTSGGSSHSYTATSLTLPCGWAGLNDELHITASGYAYYVGLEQATWAEIKIGGGS